MIKKSIWLYILNIVLFSTVFSHEYAYANNTNYKWILNPSYDYDDISNIDLWDNKYEYPIKYGYTPNNLCGISIVEKDKKYNVIDYTGELLFDNYITIKPYILNVSEIGTFIYEEKEYHKNQYNSLGSFISSLPEVGFSMGVLQWNKSVEKLGYIDITGNDDFSEINLDKFPKGSFVVQEAQSIYDKNTNSTYIKSNNKFGIVKDGEILVYPKYEEMKEFHDDMAAYRNEDKWGFVNFLGKEVIKPQYSYVNSFVHGYAPAKLNGKSGYIDNTGKEVIEFIFDETRPLDVYTGYSWVKKDGKWGVIQIENIKTNNSCKVVSKTKPNPMRLAEINPITNPASDNWLTKIIARKVGKSDISFLTQDDFNQINDIYVINEEIIEIPKEIGNLNDLKSLSLPNNKISELPIEMINLINLKSLDLSSNQLTKIPKEIENLTSLEYLYLSNNQISEVSKKIGNLTNLKILYLFGNHISEIPKEIGNLTNLEELWLYDNQIHQIPKEIGNLMHLTYLDLSKNQIIDIPKEIGNLTNLEYLVLSKNQIMDIPKEIINLTNLKGLDLSDNQITDVSGEVYDLLEDIITLQ